MMSLCIAVVESLSLAVLHFYLYIEPSSTMLFVLSIIILGPEPQTLVELSYMGGCQYYGPFLGPYYTTAPNTLGTQKGAIILTATHIPCSISLAVSMRLMFFPKR